MLAAANREQLVGRLSCGCDFQGETAYPCQRHQVEDFEDQYGTESPTLAERLAAEASQ